MEDVEEYTPVLGYWDTEWSPAISYTWTGFHKFLSNDMLIEYPRLLFWGFKFDGGKTEVVDERIGHEEMTRQLWEKLDKVDLLVSYNGQKFDTRKVNSEFMKYKMGPPSPYKEIDLFRQIKQRAQFYSGKLDFVAEKLLNKRKEETGGFKLWKEVLAGDEAAWGVMRKYQAQDVDLLEDLFNDVKPWIKMPHPVSGDPTSCHNCGGTALQRRGRALTLNGWYPRYYCTDCGKWLRGTQRTSASDIRNAL